MMRRVATAAPLRRCAVVQRRAAAEPSADQVAAIRNGMVVPYAVFGCVDMSVMLLSADFIDSNVAEAMGVSSLHAAAWGNAWGLGWGLLAMNAVGVPATEFSGASVKQAQLLGSWFGILAGCVIGMFPLVWQYFGLVRLWKEPKSAEYGAKMEAAGVDVGSFAGEILAYLKTHPEAQGKFSNLTPDAFKELLTKACPAHAANSAVIFAAMDSEGNGYITFDDFFRAMVAGPVMKDKRFGTVKWTAAEYGVAQDMVDKDHQKLFALINDVVGAMKKAEISGVVEAVRGLRGYTAYHFNREVELLQQCPSYPAAEMKVHKEKHAAFVAKVVEFESKLGDQSLAAVCDLVSGDVLTFLTDWLVTHIQNTDKRCTPYYKQHGFGSA